MDSQLILFGGILLIFIFVIILPGRKDRRRRAQMQSDLKKGDRVLVQAGLVGKVHNTKDEMVILDFDGTKIPFLKATVVRVLDEDNKESLSEADLRLR